jgi:uncharacterized protein DUF2845
MLNALVNGTPAMSTSPGLRLRHASLLPIVAALSFACVGVAAGAVFKCSAPNNGVVYQDTPCAAGAELRNLDKDPPSLSVVPGLPPASQRASSAGAAPARNARGGSERDARGEARDKLRADKTVERAGERRFIRAGMTEAEVLARIGRPDVNAHRRETARKASNKRAGAGAEWSYLPNAGDPQTITTLTIVGGKVTDVRRSIAR